MHPTPIPDAEVHEGEVRKTLGAPPGLEEAVRPIEAVCAVGGLGDRASQVYRIRVVVDDGEADRLARGEPPWLTLWGAVVPFDVCMHELCNCTPPVTIMDQDGHYCATCGGALREPPL